MNIEEILQTATAHIAREYFHFPVAGEEDPVYRERVYCYELYHQLRLHWPPECSYFLTGEVDKRNHNLIRGDILDNVKPDFLVHVPGRMDRNLLVIEVKTLDAEPDRIRIDLQKLTAFHRRGQYERAIYLIYGHGGQDELQGLRELARSFADGDGGQTIDLNTIQLWHHDAPGNPANPVDW